MDKKNELLEFAKWFIHSRRKSLPYGKNAHQVNAADFASNLMSELCNVPPFEENPLLAEYERSKQN